MKRDRINEQPSNAPRPELRARFWELPLSDLNKSEWEALCDRCGKCCLIKIEDEDTGEVAYTSLACKLFDGENCGCADYANRKKHVPDCLNLGMENIAANAYWLPESCAYIRRFYDRPLAPWHYLLSGDFSAMHEGGYSVKGRTRPESFIADEHEALAFIDEELGR